MLLTQKKVKQKANVVAAILNNCGLGVVHRKIIIGLERNDKIINPFKLFFLLFKKKIKIPIIAIIPQNCAKFPNCSAPTDKPSAISSSPAPACLL